MSARDVRFRMAQALLAALVVAMLTGAELAPPPWAADSLDAQRMPGVKGYQDRLRLLFQRQDHNRDGRLDALEVRGGTPTLNASSGDFVNSAII